MGGQLLSEMNCCADSRIAATVHDVHLTALFDFCRTLRIGREILPSRAIVNPSFCRQNYLRPEKQAGVPDFVLHVEKRARNLAMLHKINFEKRKNLGCPIDKITIQK